MSERTITIVYSTPEELDTHLLSAIQSSDREGRILARALMAMGATLTTAELSNALWLAISTGDGVQKILLNEMAATLPPEVKHTHLLSAIQSSDREGEILARALMAMGATLTTAELSDALWLAISTGDGAQKILLNEMGGTLTPELNHE